MSRQSVKVYYWSKWLAAFVCTFLAFTVPFYLGLLLNHLTFPALAGSDTLTNVALYSPTYMEYISAYLYGSLFFYSPTLYYIWCIFMLGIYSGLAAVYVLAISYFRIRYKVFLLLPLLCVDVCPAISELSFSRK